MPDSAVASGIFGNADLRGDATACTATAILPTGVSAPIRQVIHLIRQVAAFDSNVLILGESGTGKEVVARAIHDSSPRRLRPFVPINCAAIPAELLESELFGHEKGAFTGALGSRKGRFEIAAGGTIFLDEIGDLNPTMQVKLLRVLQERTFEKVGSCTSQRCDVRIVAATHRDLEQAIIKGTFREDLFYRLNVVPIEMPALRQRVEDLPHLISDLSERFASSGRPAVRFTSNTVAALKQYRWPGNVRELANLIERMSIQCSSRPVDVGDLPLRYRPADWTAEPDSAETALLATAAQSLGRDACGDRLPLEQAEAVEDELPAMDAALADTLLEAIPEGFDLRQHLETLEQQLIVRALNAANGTVAHAARLLGLRRTTLVEKLRKYSLATTEAASET